MLQLSVERCPVVTYCNRLTILFEIAYKYDESSLSVALIAVTPSSFTAPGVMRMSCSAINFSLEVS